MDNRKIDYSIKGIYWSKFITRVIYIPFVKFFLMINIKLGTPLGVVNALSLILALISATIIVFYPKLVFLSGIILFFSFVMDIVGNALAKYLDELTFFQRWIDEANGVLRMFLIFFAGAIYLFKTNQEPIVFLLSEFAIFSYMMMVFAGAMIEFLTYRYSQKEDVTNFLKKGLGKKNQWIIKSPLSFSFEYQWTFTILLVMFNQFEALYWIFILFGSMKWVQAYFMALKSK
jgi:hypothetical protein